MRPAQISETDWRRVISRLDEHDDFREDVGRLIVECSEAKEAAGQAAEYSLRVSLEMAEFKETLRSLEEFRDNSAIIEIGVLRGKVKRADAWKDKVLYALVTLLAAAAVKELIVPMLHH